MSFEIANDLRKIIEGLIIFLTHAYDGMLNTLKLHIKTVLINSLISKCKNFAKRSPMKNLDHWKTRHFQSM